MKKLCFFLLTICLIGTACEKNSKKDYDLISSNLLKNGSHDSTLLIGKWDCVKFAYTKDGESISDVATLSKGNIEIPDMSNQWYFNYNNQWRVEHSISSSLIKLSLYSMTYINVLQEEENIVSILENAYSFVIKDDELMILFTGVDDKNLLIFKKR